MNKSIYLYAAIVGIMRGGGVYVPLRAQLRPIGRRPPLPAATPTPTTARSPPPTSSSAASSPSSPPRALRPRARRPAFRPRRRAGRPRRGRARRAALPRGAPGAAGGQAARRRARGRARATQRRPGRRRADGSRPCARRRRPAAGNFRRSPLAPRLRPRPAIYSETMYPLIHFGWSDLASIVSGDLHLVDGLDPSSSTSPATRASARIVRRRSAVRSPRCVSCARGDRSHPRPRAAPADAETIAALGALGYLGTPSAQRPGRAWPIRATRCARSRRCCAGSAALQ